MADRPKQTTCHSYLLEVGAGTNHNPVHTQESNRWAQPKGASNIPTTKENNDQTKQPRVHAQPPHSARERTHLSLVPQGPQHRSRPPYRSRQRRHRRPRKPVWKLQKMQLHTRKQIPKRQTNSPTTIKSRTPPNTKKPQKNRKTKKHRNFFKK